MGEKYIVYKESQSGTKLGEGRAEFDRLQKDVVAGKVTKVWIVKEDRLSRNSIVAVAFLELLKEDGCFLYDRLPCCC